MIKKKHTFESLEHANIEQKIHNNEGGFHCINPQLSHLFYESRLSHCISRDPFENRIAVVQKISLISNRKNSPM